MIGEVFYWTVNMSVVAAVTGTVVWALGHIRRIPSRAVCVLWIIPLIRLTVPIGIDAPYSLMTWLSKAATVTAVRNVPVSVFGNHGISMTNCIQAANGYFPLTFETNRLETVFAVGGVIWLTVAVCLLTLSAITYRSQIALIADAQHVKENIYLCHRLSSPAVYGIFRPKIVLPRKYDEQELSLILRHETAHIRRKDNWWRAIALTVACIHWFNPAVWLFVKSFTEHTELACDEAVLRHLSKEDAAAYARLLLSHAQVKATVTSPFGGGQLRRRILRILSYRKLSVLAAVSSSLLVIVCIAVLTTNRI